MAETQPPPIWRPAELASFLSIHGLTPSRRLSQNFLIDGNIVRKIVATAALEPGTPVLEIGSGPGALTQEILSRGAKLIAVEKDERLASLLKRFQTPDERLHVIAGDILDLSLSELPPIGTPLTLIANLPYHLTTPIIVALLPHYPLIKRMILMVQDEVARRLTSLPGTQEWGSISLFTRLYCHPSYAFKVSRHSFLPVPNVDSAIITLDLHPPLLDPVDPLLTLTRLAFQHRRKQLRVSLKPLYPSTTIDQALVAIGRDYRTRPEELSPEEFIALLRQLQP